MYALSIVETTLPPDERIDQIVAVFETPESAELAIRQLVKIHLDSKNLTLVGRDYHGAEHPTAYALVGDRMLAWGKFGAFWGSIWGVLFSSAILFVPEIDALILAGWLVKTVVGSAEGAIIGGGLGAITAAFASIGFPKESILIYEDLLREGKLLLIVRGSPAEIDRAKSILLSLGATGLEVNEHRNPTPHGLESNHEQQG